MLDIVLMRLNKIHHFYSFKTINRDYFNIQTWTNHQLCFQKCWWHKSEAQWTHRALQADGSKMQENRTLLLHLLSETFCARFCIYPAFFWQKEESLKDAACIQGSHMLFKQKQHHGTDDLHLDNLDILSTQAVCHHLFLLLIVHGHFSPFFSIICCLQFPRLFTLIIITDFPALPHLPFPFFSTQPSGLKVPLHLKWRNNTWNVSREIIINAGIVRGNNHNRHLRGMRMIPHVRLSCWRIVERLGVENCTKTQQPEYMWIIIIVFFFIYVCIHVWHTNKTVQTFGGGIEAPGALL